jgi:uncharacterized protein (TIGR03086 family)
MEMIDLFDQGTEWTASKIPGAVDKLDASTPCEEWDVRALLNHMFDTLRYFTEAVDDSSAALPTPTPPDVLGADPVKEYEAAREHALRAYGEPGVVERTGPSLGIAFVDQLVHGSDLARATGQDATIPDDLAGAAFAMVDGNITDDRRANAFKPAIHVSDRASAHDRLLAYLGRVPAGR